MTGQPKGEKGFKSLGSLASKVSLPDRKQRNLVRLIAASLLLILAISSLFYGKDAFQYLKDLFSDFQSSSAHMSQKSPQNRGQQNSPPVINRFQFEMREPPVSPDHKHTLPEIRWCLALSRFLDGMRKTLHASENLEAYNNRVQYYNDRCGHFSANAQSLAQARKDIESLAAADLHSLFDITPKPDGKSERKIDSGAPMLTESQLAELQRMLVELGYMQGPVTGKMNEQTASAIKAFQKDIDKPQTGAADLESFTYLQIVYEDLLTWLETGAKPAWLK